MIARKVNDAVHARADRSRSAVRAFFTRAFVHVPAKVHVKSGPVDSRQFAPTVELRFFFLSSAG